jgi:hypothetical protein
VYAVGVVSISVCCWRGLQNVISKPNFMIISRLFQKFGLDKCARARTHAHTVWWSQELAFFVLSERKFVTGHWDTWRAAVHTVMNLRVLSNSGNILTSCGTISFSKSTVLYGIGLLLVGCFLVSWLGNYLVSQVGR